MPEYLAPGVYTEEVSFRPKSIEGVSTSTTAFVGPTRRGPLTGTPEVVTSYGEFARIYGGVSNLSFGSTTDGNPNALNYLGHAVQQFFNEGGSRLYIGRVFVPRAVDNDGRSRSTQFVNDSGQTAQFVGRTPGSGNNGVVNVFEKRSPATATTLEAAPEGSFVRIGGTTTVQGAVLVGAAGPFSVNHNDTLVLTTNGAVVTITFEGTAAEETGAALVAPVSVPADTTFTVTAGGVQQTVTLPTGDNSLQELADFLNGNLRYVSVALVGDALVIRTDRRGTAASLTVEALSLLGFDAAAPRAGAGNVASLDHISVSEIDGLLQAEQGGTPDVRAATRVSDGAIQISSTAGDPPQLTASGQARTALGLSGDLAEGTAGATPEFYFKLGSSWSDGGGGTLDTGTLAPETTELVMLNLETVDGDGNSTIYEDLGFHSSHPRFVGTVLTENPSRRIYALYNPFYLDITDGVTPQQLHSGLFGGSDSNSISVANGNDGLEPVGNISDAGSAGYTQALELLEDIPDIAIVAAPGHSAYASYQDVQGDLISHCERMKYRMAVLDTQSNLTPGEARLERSRIDSTYAALYYPWVIVANPLARPGDDRIPKEIALPPSGFVAGIYARSDNTVGVWKAPANEVVRGALRFERDVNHRVQEVLNPEGINCLRYFYGRGYRVWGARTVSSDPEWKYVNIRRYFIYLEASIYRSTQWAVFMPNGERLWANITDTINAFLYNEWRSGALLGGSPEEAYFVRCDRSTMTQADLDNGRLICEIGVAALKPAEFVIFRIGQKTADSGG